MSYQSEVLADAPKFYARLDELSGTIINDISGFGNHGTYQDPLKGILSPIETDPASTAVRGAVGRVPAAIGSDLDFLGNFTWECWGYYDEDLLPAQAAHLINRRGQIVQSLTVQCGFNSGGVFGHITLENGGSGDWFTLFYPDIADKAWYHIVVTRNSTVARLYVNGLLRDENTSLTTADVDYNVDGNDWFLGRSIQTNAFSSAGTDEIALYDYALTAARVLVHYEAAKLVLPLTATISVRVIVELDTDQVIPIDFPFAHNFAEPLSGSPRPIVEHLTYKTNVNQSEPDYQQRVNAQPHHVERTLETFVTPTSARARSMMQAALWTPGQTYKLPVSNDWGTLTAQATAAASTISLDTIKKDYEIGSYVVVWEDVYQPWTAQFFEITSRTDTQLGVTPNVGDTLPLGSPVMPARLAILPEDSLSPDSHLMDRETVPLQFEILSTELSSRRVTAYTPAATYLSIEVFNLERAKVEWLDPSPYQISRRQQGTGNSTGNDYLRAIDTGSPQTIPIRVLLTSRAALSEFYGWLDARSGKQNPVWVVSEENDLEVVARFGSPGRIDINNIGYTARYNVHSARRHIAFLLTNGTYNFKRVTAAVDNGATERLTLSADPPALADISKTSFLRLCTAPDQFELKYHRDGTGFIAQCEWVFSELLATPE